MALQAAAFSGRQHNRPLPLPRPRDRISFQNIDSTTLSDLCEAHPVPVLGSGAGSTYVSKDAMAMFRPDWSLQRQRMVDDQLIPRGINDPRGLDAMCTVPRHQFVPEEARKESYADHPVPIGGGQTISQPYIVALMSELLQLDGSQRVLEIGAGCGYQTAILASLAKMVRALELEESLAANARDHLSTLGVANVDLLCADGFAPWPGGGEFDCILCACAPEKLPSAFFDQLAPGGCLVVPIGPPNSVQTLFCYHRRDDGSVEIKHREPVRFVPMRSSRSLS